MRSVQGKGNPVAGEVMSCLHCASRSLAQRLLWCNIKIPGGYFSNCVFVQLWMHIRGILIKKHPRVRVRISVATLYDARAPSSSAAPLTQLELAFRSACPGATSKSRRNALRRPSSKLFRSTFDAAGTDRKIWVARLEFVPAM